jgi:hypothetical protein
VARAVAVDVERRVAVALALVIDLDCSCLLVPVSFQFFVAAFRIAVRGRPVFSVGRIRSEAGSPVGLFITNQNALANACLTSLVKITFALRCCGC